MSVGQTEFEKSHFLESHLAKLGELTRRQCEYKKIVSVTTNSKDSIVENKIRNTALYLRKERNELRSTIWVATSGSNEKINKRNLSDIKCHIECQENLSADISKLKENIANMERDKNRVTREIAALNKKTVPDAQFQEHVARTRKKAQNLENQLEVSKRRECDLRAQNAKLREELVKILNDRTIFNESYTKLVQRLTRDKKYLMDLIEYALGTFENCINIYEKMDALNKKEDKDKEKCKGEMEQIIRQMEADMANSDFLNVKTQKRSLADLTEKEYRRREAVRLRHQKQLSLYTRVMAKIMNYTKSKKIQSVIDKFKEQENLYYSYFNYANEVSYHVTLLEHAVSRLYGDIRRLKDDNKGSLYQQLGSIEKLQRALRDKQAHNKALTQRRLDYDRHLDQLVAGIEDIFEISRADASPLLDLLGDHNHVQLVNLPRVLKIIEKRVWSVTAGVYVIERLDLSKSAADYVVQQIHKLCDWPTALDDIVLTQQCPECAEGDAFHIDEGGETAINPLTKREAQRKMYEKVTQPEMQYRLHSVEECRLPRSRILAAKRNT